MDLLQNSSDSQSDESPEKETPSASSRFKCAILESYYRTGMVGTGKVYTFRHQRAAKEIGCTVDKVKVKAL